jgi:competence protein ComEA
MKLFHTLFLTLILLFSSSAMSAQTSTAKINVNTANAQQIATTMTGVGESKAKAIVQYRKTNGKFKTLQDLENVDGIGAKTVEKNKGKILL